MGIDGASRATLHASVFLSCVSFAIVMPTLWPYLRSLGAGAGFLAWVVSFYSVGEGLGAVLFGAACVGRPTRGVMVAATCVGVLGSGLYALAGAVGAAAAAQQHWRTAARGMVFAGRFAQGVWTGGAQAIQQAHLAKALPPAALTPATVTINAYACLGFVVGPAFGLVFAAAPPACAGPVCVDQLTGPGFFTLASAAAIVAAFALCFSEDPPGSPPPTPPLPPPPALRPTAHYGSPRAAQSARPRAAAAHTGERAPLLPPTTSPADGAFRALLATCNIVFFVHFYGFALQETITTPLVQAFYSWSVLRAELLFVCAGAVSLTTFAAVLLLSARVSDRAFTTASLVLGALGFALLLGRVSAPPSEARFMVAFCLVTVAFPLGRAGVLSLYTKTLPPKLQGPGQGVILAVGAAARITGPFCAVAVFAADRAPAAVFGATAAVFAATAAGFHAATATPRAPECEPLTAVP